MQGVRPPARRGRLSMKKGKSRDLDGQKSLLAQSLAGLVGPGAGRRQPQKRLPMQRRVARAAHLVQDASQMVMGVGIGIVVGQRRLERPRSPDLFLPARPTRIPDWPALRRNPRPARWLRNTVRGRRPDRASGRATPPTENSSPRSGRRRPSPRDTFRRRIPTVRRPPIVRPIESSRPAKPPATGSRRAQTSGCRRPTACRRAWRAYRRPWRQNRTATARRPRTAHRLAAPTGACLRQ